MGSPMQLSPFEQFFLGSSAETRNLPVISVVLSFDERANIDEPFVERHFASRLLAIPRFRAVFSPDGKISRTLDEPQPVAQFCLEKWEAANGVQRSEKRFVQSVTLEGSVDQKLSELATTVLNTDYPLWEVILARSDASQPHPGATHLIVRVHHCLADGISLLSILERLLTATDAPIDQDTSPIPGAGFLNRAFSNYGLLAPFQLIARFFYAVWKLAFLVLIPDRPSVLSGKSLSADKEVTTFTTDFQKLSFVSKTLKFTVTEVFIALACGASRQIMQQCGQEARFLHPVNVILPFSQRRSESVPVCRNQMTPLKLQAPVGAPNPLDRLAEVHKKMELLKNGFEVGVTRSLMATLQIVPRSLRDKLWFYLASSSSLVVSTVKGPPTALTLGGNELQGIRYVGVSSGTNGTVFSHITYGGQVYSSVLVDLALNKAGSAGLARAWREELDALYEEAQARVAKGD